MNEPIVKTMKKMAVLLSFILVAVGSVMFVDHYVFVLQTCKPTKWVNDILKTNFSCSPRLYYPTGIAFDSHGNLFVADSGNHVVRKVTPEGKVTVFAGKFGRRGHQNGPALQATFMAPAGITLDRADNLYIADQGNDQIRKIDHQGMVSTYAGFPEQKGHVDGDINLAKFNSPTELEFNRKGELIVLDIGNNSIRSINQQRQISTLFGKQSQRACARLKNCYLNGPVGLTIGSNDEVYIADTYNHVIRKFEDPLRLIVFSGYPAAIGKKDGIFKMAQYKNPNDVALDDRGELYVLDSGNGLIRHINKEGSVKTLVLKTKGKFLDAHQLNHPRSFLWRQPHYLFVSDTGSHTVKKINVLNGEVEVILGVPGKKGRSNGI